jgi:para-nitrobenzyl esterase
MRARWLSACVFAAVGCVAPVAGSGDALQAPALSGAPDGTQVQLASGWVQGLRVGQTREFLGIPYAAPPLGALRFAPPQPPAAWSGVRAASSFGPSCMQPAGGVPGELSEDCLTLNVFAPGDPPAAPRPVLVFLHGGGFTRGGSATYDARALRERGDVLVVTLNYRLGPFGFLAHPELCQACSNLGLRDQQRALSWVAENVAAFGGDPDNVTLFGESAGSVSVCAHMFAQGSERLARRFIMESGSCVHGPLALQPLAAVRAAGRTLASSLCPGALDPVACLRALPAQQLADVSLDTLDPVVDGFWPWVDGELFTEQPERALAAGKRASGPLLIGTNQREWLLWQALFATPEAIGTLGLYANIAYYFPRHAAVLAAHYVPASELDAGETFLRLMTDAYFRCPTRALLRGAAAVGGTGYLYEFAVAPAAHALEVDYVFGISAVSQLFPLQAPDPPLPGVVQAMQGYWTSFATDGVPRGPGLPAWPAYTRERDPHLRLAEPVTIERGLAQADCDLWDALWQADAAQSGSL